MTRFLLLSNGCGLVYVGRSLWREDGSVVYNCCWPSPAQSFSGQSLVGLATLFYCLRVETSLFIASYYDLQGHGGGIRPRLHTGVTVPICVCISKTVSRQPSREHLVDGFDLSVVTKTTPLFCRKRLLMYSLSRECIYSCILRSYCSRCPAVDGRSIQIFRLSGGTPQYFS
jgi:hypothetical protein